MPFESKRGGSEVCTPFSDGHSVLTGERQSREDQTKDQGLAERFAGDHPKAG